jgi:hypothetical protein
MGRRIQHTEEFVGDIVEALTAYGGAAHRSLVVEQIAVARVRRGAPLRIDPTTRIQREFESHLGDLFRLPFGEGSHRWALAGAIDRL